TVLGLSVTFSVDSFKREKKPLEALYDNLLLEAWKHYETKVQTIGEENFSYIERRIALDLIDARWKDHLYTMDHLREGIWAISYSERNPLVEYKIQGFRLFDAMVLVIKEQITEFLFRVEVE